MSSPALTLTEELITKPSITPNDEGCQLLIAERLKKVGFTVEHFRFEDVDNLYARYGKASPLFLFAGHTDVVPPGPLTRWTSSPFQPVIRDGLLYGRGAADMKGGIAAMVCASENFVKQHPHFQGSIGFLITSDEEGIAINGTVKVIEQLQLRQEKIDWCLVGEPTSEEQVGDVIKVGRRGSLSGKLEIHGKQGHVGYPHLADNAIHRSLCALHELTETVWDNGNTYFPSTTFQITDIHAGTGADNVIPGHLEAHFNFRFSNEVTAEELEQRVIDTLKKYGLIFSIDWKLSGEPFLTTHGELLKAADQAVEEIMHFLPKHSTTGGTSDGRFIAKTGAQVIELGPRNRCIHQIDEYISLQDLEKLTTIYHRILEILLLPTT